MKRSIGVYIASICISVILIGGAFLATEETASAQTGGNVSSEVNRIKDEISARNARLQDIQKEIAQYQVELEKVGAEKGTLQKAINQLELERKKVQADLSYTQNKIGATDLELQRLSIEIDETESAIATNRNAIEEILRRINESDESSIVETLFSHEDLSSFWEEIDSLGQVRTVMGDQVRDYSELKDILDSKRSENQETRGELVALKNQYSGQKQVLEVNKTVKNQLLAETQNKEENYQTLLAEREAEKERFERELRAYEIQLQFILDPSTIPQAGSSVLAWPVSPPTITQKFGNTAFAQSGGYNGNGHNGIDFRAPTGTSIRAALSGEVLAVNINVAYMCQYGKWVLIRHANGLTTLYAHLSVVSVDPGDTVSTGDVIGYSGDTGYALGPHLHFTVYASNAVKFTQYTCNSGATLTIPVSAYSGYLNPLSYLPPA